MKQSFLIKVLKEEEIMLNIIKQEIINGSIRIVEHTNLAYVKPHQVITKDKLYLFFNCI
jgi:hypothetical protein